MLTITFAKPFADTDATAASLADPSTSSPLSLCQFRNNWFAAARAAASAADCTRWRSSSSTPPSIARAAKPSIPVRQTATSRITVPFRAFRAVFIDVLLIGHGHDRGAPEADAAQKCLRDPLVNDGHRHGVAGGH